MNYTISKYTPDNLPSSKVGNAIGDLLDDNFPKCESDTSKQESLKKRNTSEKINKRIQEGCTYFTVQDTKNKVLGFSEMKLIEVEGGYYVHLCWLVIDSLSQGVGLASRLHKEFETEAREIGATLKGKWCLELSTHTDNPAQEIYKKWGYKKFLKEGNKGESTDIHMYKDI